MKKAVGLGLTVATLLWSNFASSGANLGNIEQNLTMGWTFGASTAPALSLSLRIEQPADIGTALSAFLGATAPATTDPSGVVQRPHSILPALAQWDWRSQRGCRVRVNGLSLFSSHGRQQLDDSQPESGMSTTTKVLLGGAALAAVAVAVSGGGSGGGSGGSGGENGGGSCASCNSDAFHVCDGQVSAVCDGSRLDDDGDCSTTCDTL